MPKKDCWDKLKIFVSIISSIIIPFVIAGSGYYINATLQKMKL